MCPSFEKTLEVASRKQKQALSGPDGSTEDCISRFFVTELLKNLKNLGVEVLDMARTTEVCWTLLRVNLEMKIIPSIPWLWNTKSICHFSPKFGLYESKCE